MGLNLEEIERIEKYPKDINLAFSDKNFCEGCGKEIKIEYSRVDLIEARLKILEKKIKIIEEKLNKVV